jgi:hypothetical protein
MPEMSVKIKRGNTFVFEIPVYDLNGDLVETLASTTAVKFHLKASKTGQYIVEKTKGSGIAVDTPSTGYVQIVLTPTDTDQDIKTYLYGLQCEWSAAEVYEVFTKIDGAWDDEIEIVQDIVNT